MQRRKTSAIIDASEYIKRLKQKLEELNQAVAKSQNTTIDYDSMPKVESDYVYS